MCDVLLDLYEEAKTGLRIVEAHICKPGQPPETRAELRGRELAYRTIVNQIKVAITQHDRAGKPSNIEGAIHHIEAAERLIDAVKDKGYKAEYAKRHCLQKTLPGAKQSVIGLWNVVSEERASGA